MQRCADRLHVYKEMQIVTKHFYLVNMFDTWEEESRNMSKNN
jgi:hypothetical protein